MAHDPDPIRYIAREWPWPGTTILAPNQWPAAAAWSAIHTVNVPASRPAHTTPGRADRNERDWNLIYRVVTQAIPALNFSGNTLENFQTPRLRCFLLPIKKPRCSEALSNNQIFYSEGWIR